MSVLATKDWGAGTGALPSSWSTASGNTALSVNGGEAYCNNDPECSYRNDVTPPNDQYATATIGSVVVTASDNGIGPCIRQATGADTRYFVMGSTVDSHCYKVVAGAYTQIGSTAGSVTTGDVLYIEAQSTAVVCKKNGSNIITATDSAVTAGRFGIFGANQSENPKASDFEGGDFASAGANPKGPLGNPFFGPFGGPI